MRSIVLEHEKRDFGESWRNFRQFSLTVYELLHEAGALEEAARSLVARLAALEQQGTTPSYDHFGLGQHFDLECRRVRTYPAKAREFAPAGALPAYGLSRTRCRMMDMASSSAPDPAKELGIDGLVHEPVAAPMAEAKVAPQDLEQGAPHGHHYLEMNVDEGTSLEGTHLSRFQGVRHWLNTTRLHGQTLNCIQKWLWYGENHPTMKPNQNKTWRGWLRQYRPRCTEAESIEVALEMETAFSVSRAALLSRSAPELPSAKLVSQAEYRKTEGNLAMALWGDPSSGKVAASGRSSSLLNLDWIARNGRGYGPRRDKPAPATSFIVTKWAHGAVV